MTVITPAIINIIPVANSFMFLRQDRPEIVCEIGEPKTFTVPDINRKEFTHKIQKEFEELIELHALNGAVTDKRIFAFAFSLAIKLILESKI